MATSPFPRVSRIPSHFPKRGIDAKVAAVAALTKTKTEAKRDSQSSSKTTEASGGTRRTGLISTRMAGESVEKKYRSRVSATTKQTEKTYKYEACPPKPGEVPQFNEQAHGTPLLWNLENLFWGKRLKNRSCFAQNINSSVEESLSRVREFLRARSGPDDLPILGRLRDVSEDTGCYGWYEFRWAPFEDAGGMSSLPTASLGPYGGGASDWQSAWHACKFEALYSIMYHGHLFASCDAKRGDRFFGKAPGVYLHKEATCSKTGNYFRFVPLCRDGVFWAALWEVMVDRSDRVAVSGTDQWVQRERSVRLKALWLAGCTYGHMQPGTQVSESWDPLLEAHPMAQRNDKMEQPALCMIRFQQFLI